jgi:hypothetical protein
MGPTLSPGHQIFCCVRSHTQPAKNSISRDNRNLPRS